MASPPTHWSLVLEAQGEAARCTESTRMGGLDRTIAPLYGCRRHGLGREEAQDLVQEFFARLLEHRNLNTVRREKGRLRSYCLCRSNVSRRRAAIAPADVKRYESGPHIPLDELLESEVADLEWRKPGPLTGFTSGIGP